MMNTYTKDDPKWVAADDVAGTSYTWENPRVVPAIVVQDVDLFDGEFVDVTVNVDGNERMFKKKLIHDAPGGGLCVLVDAGDEGWWRITFNRTQIRPFQY